MQSIDEIVGQNQRKIQVLREDHHEMVSSHMRLNEDLSVAHQQVRELADTARKVKEGRDLELNKVLERSLSVEAQARVVEALQAEHTQVVGLVKDLSDSNAKLSSDFNSLHSELLRVQLQSSDVLHLKADVDTMRLELHKGRAAIEFEKKTRVANLQQYQSLERNIASLKTEMETLHRHLSNLHKPPTATPPPPPPAPASIQDPAYSATYGAPDVLFRGGHHSSHYPMHHQGTIPGDGATHPLYGPPSGGHDPFDMRQAHVPKG